MVGSTVIL